MPALLPGRHSLRVIMARPRRLAVATRPPVPTIRAALAVLVVLVAPVITRAVRAAPVVRVAPVITPVVLAAPVTTPAALAAPVVLAAPVITPVVLAAPVIIPTTPVARVAPATTPAGLAAPAITPVLRADSVDPILTPVARGMATLSAATSMAPRGATDPDPGARASRRGRHGIDRFPRPVGAGTTARSTTGATRKPQCGIPVSTSGDSGSSECGSRCDR
ncbi:hypothetical protein MTY59_36840 [Mycobacterium senriense]|uniref:Uncharacterized protein n=1 Tax=Mycobacterium senriense TaxID=2775496 RepID=A0ABN6INP2_9MYCO|nr:hypothetical protein MTY59_36840 [Mycobacterium senriense]